MDGDTTLLDAFCRVGSQIFFNGDSNCKVYGVNRMSIGRDQDIQIRMFLIDPTKGVVSW